MPRLTVIVIALLKSDRVDDVRGDQEHAETYEHKQETNTQRYELLHVDSTRIRPAPQPGDPGPDSLKDNDRQFATVKRQERQKVEESDEDVDFGHDQHQEGDLLLPDHPLVADDLTGVLADSDYARHAAAVGRPVASEQLGNRFRQRRDAFHRTGDDL